MNVLIIGGGGREHALAWKAALSPQVSTVYVAPGNAGTAGEQKVENIGIEATDIERLKAFAISGPDALSPNPSPKGRGEPAHYINLTIVGPEAPLAAGIVDEFTKAGLRIFGPTAGATQLESSKAFCKAFMKRHNIPTATYETFTNLHEAKAYIEHNGAPIVIKADGLAAGKGVVVAKTKQEAIDAITNMLENKAFGDASCRVVIESFLTGQEASFIVMCDGEHILPLATSQDHKARDNGDRGPNTGGMGAYSPAPVVTPELHDKIMNDVIKPTIQGMKDEGYPYTGFLYAGVMIDKDNDIHVLEFNCRFGDPETQPILFRLKSDLIDLCEAAIDQKLDTVSAEWDTRAALGVVLAAGGYPLNYKKGDVITGLNGGTQDVKVFHAGTKIQDADVVTSGGRVLCVTALGDDVKTAQKKAYQQVDKIHWDNMYFRTDIGYRAIGDTE